MAPGNRPNDRKPRASRRDITKGVAMIVLGVILIILGFLLPTLVPTLGSAGRAVGGRRHYY
jgi:uncharacterized membrane protein